MFAAARGTCLAFKTIQTLSPAGTRSIKRWVAPVLRVLKHRVEREKFKNNGFVMDKLKNRRSNYPEWSRPAELYAFSSRLSENIDEAILDSAFTHRSYIIAEEAKQRALGIENPEILIADNRDLVLEGDKFIRDYVLAYTSALFPKFPEAGLFAIRDYLISREMIASISKAMGTLELILSQDYPPDEQILADTFKAIVAALIHSSGEERASFFVRDFVITQLNGVDVNELWKIDDPVAMLKDLLKKKGTSEPEARLLGHVGINTILACYRVGFYIDKKFFSSGYGETQEIALEMAARDGLMKLFGTEDNAPAFNFKLDLVMSTAQNRIASSSHT